ncbi:MAG: amidohydrolase family protein [Phycisphaeraceae bacterium]|nr:amidohydrolase family protein [Phycisphaeraceae bacterium]
MGETRTISGTLMLQDGRGGVRLTPGTLHLADGVIQRVSEGIIDPRPDHGGEQSIIMPGFVDAHMHLPQFDSIGIDGFTLLDWLERAIFPAECAWEDPDVAGEVATRAAQSLLSFGTTSVCAYGTVHHDGTKASIEAVAAAGMRAMVGQVLMDRNAPPELCRGAVQLVREAVSLTEWTRGFAASRGARIEHSINPRFAISCTPELLSGAGEAVQRLHAPMQTHVSESTGECEVIARFFDGRSYVGVYQDAGLLGPRSILAHGVWLDEAERSTLAATHSMIAHCPTANMFLQSGDCDLGALGRSGVRLAVGSDIAGGNERSMVRVARAMIETSKRVAASTGKGGVIAAGRAWWMITSGNADAIGWKRTSRLEPGAEADVLVVTPDVRWQEAVDPLGTLLYAWDDRWIEQTLVAGMAVTRR